MVKVYANALDVMGRRLYTGKTTWLREYLQNSIDAGADEIEILIRGNELCINDNGVGMDEFDIVDKAFSIGNPDLNTAKIGELGIGIYAGLGISNRIKVLTKKSGKAVLEAVFDVNRYYQIIEDQGKRGMPFDEVMSEVFSVEKASIQGREDEHFTKITFEDILEERTNVPTSSQVKNFVRNNINVPINPNFKWKKEIDEFVKGLAKEVHISVDDGSGKLTPIDRYENIDVPLYKPYKVSMPIAGRPGKEYARAWFCYSKTGSSFDQSKVIVRFKGMVIGDESTLEFRTGSRIEKRLLGEIVVSEDSGLEVNSERNWFVSSGRLVTFQKELINLLGDVHTYYSKQDSDYGIVIANKESKLHELEEKRQENLGARNSGIVSQLDTQIASLKRSIEDKRQRRDKRIKELEEISKKNPDNQLVSQSLEILKDRKAEDTVKIDNAHNPGQVKPPRKPSFPTAVQTFLRENVIDPELAKEIEEGNVRQVSSSAFIFIELLLKRRAGWPEGKPVTDFSRLVNDFKDRNSPPDLKGGDVKKFFENFDRLVNAGYHFFRNPSSHGFMVDLDRPRHIFQAMLLADFIVYLIGQFVPKGS